MGSDEDGWSGYFGVSWLRSLKAGLEGRKRAGEADGAETRDDEDEDDDDDEGDGDEDEDNDDPRRLKLWMYSRTEGWQD